MWHLCDFKTAYVSFIQQAFVTPPRAALQQFAVPRRSKYAQLSGPAGGSQMWAGAWRMPDVRCSGYHPPTKHRCSCQEPDPDPTRHFDSLSVLT